MENSISNPVDRILRVLENLSEVAGQGISLSEICARLDVAHSTGHRILGDLEAAGYVYKSEAKQYFPNFTFERQLPVAGGALGHIHQVCVNVSGRLQTASEVIFQRGPNLLWHCKEEHPLQAIRLRAHAGFVRGTYELDSISRLALAYLPAEKIEASWDLAAFHETGVLGTKVPWTTAQELIASVDRDGVEYDLLGNAKGVRRFCVAIAGQPSRLLCLLTVAEAATPVRNEDAHIDAIRTVLTEARDEILDGFSQTPTGRGNVAAAG